MSSAESERVKLWNWYCVLWPVRDGEIVLVEWNDGRYLTLPNPDPDPDSDSDSDSDPDSDPEPT